MAARKHFGASRSFMPIIFDILIFPDLKIKIKIEEKFKEDFKI